MSALKEEANNKKEELVQTEVKGRSMGMGNNSSSNVEEPEAEIPAPTEEIVKAPVVNEPTELELKAKETLEKVVKKEAPKINVPDLNIVAGENIPKYEENINTTSKFNMLPEMEKSKKELTTEVKEKSLPEKVDEKERYVTDDQFFDDFFADDEDL